ncbi:MAG: hypothetical protein ABJC10_01785 [Acidobacteriota bacterium]
MSTRAISRSIVICVLTLLSTQSFAQNVERHPVSSPMPSKQPSASLSASGNSIDAVVNEIDLLRNSLQTLNTRLREISEKLPALDSKQIAGSNDKQKPLASSLELLARAEDRAGVLRKQLLELIEKDTSYRSRLAQIDEDMRPENIERVLNRVGTTRTAEIRDVRRRSLDIEKRGPEGLVSVTTQSRPRLEEDLRQAESFVSRIRQRLLPLIEREIEKINPY